MGFKNNIKKNSNKGFSLVEILVAVIILGIIVAPMLRSFVLSSQMNQRSRRTMNAVKIAEDVMESIKSMQAEDLDLEFVSGNCTLIDSSMIGGSVSEPFARLLVDEAGDMSEQPSSVSFDRLDKRAYVIRGIRPMSGRNESYDALIIVDPGNYVIPTGEAINNAGYFNSNGVFSLESEGNKAAYSQSFDTFAKVVNNLVEEIGDDWSAEQSTIHREINVNIEKTGSTGSVVTLLQTFTLEGPDGTIVKRIPSTGVPQILYDATKRNNEDMDELFFSYYPLYKGDRFSAVDTIIVNNATTDMEYKPVINLIKQKVEDGGDKRDFSALYGIETYSDDYVFNDRLANLENIYNTNLKVEVPVVDSVKLKGNIGINVATLEDFLTRNYSVEIEKMGNEVVRTRYFDVNVLIYKGGDLAEDCSGYNDKVLYSIEGSAID